MIEQATIYILSPPHPQIYKTHPYSPDGTFLAVADGTVTLWEKTAEQCLARLPLFGHEIAFLPESEELMVVDITGKVSFWDLKRQRVTYSFQALPDGVEAGCLAVSSYASVFALTCSTGKVCCWLFENSRGEAVLLAEWEANFDEGITLSSDGKLLALLTAPSVLQREAHVHVYDIETQSLRSDFLVPTSAPGTERSQALAFSSEDMYLAVADRSGKLSFWDLNAQQFSFVFLPILIQLPLLRCPVCCVVQGRNLSGDWRLGTD